nr:immunoglobulin light chain junction region [Macaca mulatta]MOX72536.1 immunoglobulin light chain junction region [Macaca mulatta]
DYYCQSVDISLTDHVLF